MIRYKLIHQIENKYRFNYFVWDNEDDYGEILIDLDNIDVDPVIKLAPSDETRMFAGKAAIAAYDGVMSKRNIEEGTSFWL